jgi:hypothetical protein
MVEQLRAGLTWPCITRTRDQETILKPLHGTAYYRPSVFTPSRFLQNLIKGHTPSPIDFMTCPARLYEVGLSPAVSLYPLTQIRSKPQWKKELGTGASGRLGMEHLFVFSGTTPARL